MHHSDTMYYIGLLSTCSLFAILKELSLIWAQVALCKLTTGADLTVVAKYTANTKVDSCSFMAGIAQFSPFSHIHV